MLLYPHIVDFTLTTLYIHFAFFFRTTAQYSNPTCIKLLPNIPNLVSSSIELLEIVYYICLFSCYIQIIY